MMQGRIELTPELKESLLNPEILPPELTIKGIQYVLKSPVAAGHKAAVWKAIDEYGRPRAVKFAIYEDYEDRSFLSELALAAKLETYDEFAKFIAADILDLDFPQ